MNQELYRTRTRRASRQPADAAANMQERAAGGRHGRHFESVTSYQRNTTPSFLKLS